jgi:hypothetical protein
MRSCRVVTIVKEGVLVLEAQTRQSTCALRHPPTANVSLLSETAGRNISCKPWLYSLRHTWTE